MMKKKSKNIDNDPDMADDIDGLSDASDDELSGITEKIQKLKKQLADCQKEKQEYLDGWQRTKAEAVNARRESTERAEGAAMRGHEEVARELFPALDSFDMARKSPQWDNAPENWKVGMEQVHGQLEQALAHFNIIRFGETGEVFDPTMHEAVGVDGDGDNEAVVAEVIRSGWKMGEKMLRPAQVKISH